MVVMASKRCEVTYGLQTYRGIDNNDKKRRSIKRADVP
jgi:hypothetical protein